MRLKIYLEMASKMDEILNNIATSVEGTNESITKLLDGDLESDFPDLVKQLLSDGKNKLEDVSLLNLKNNAMLSYIHNVCLIILSSIERLHSSSDTVNESREKAIESSIIQRVTLERGVKPLEKKLSYQLDKMVRVYNKLLADQENKEETQDDKNNDNDSSEEESEDELAYRPDASSLMKSSKKPTASKENTEEAYKPPKISAVAPPTKEESKARPSKKLQSMEEYLRENSNLPTEEKSIGVNIVNHGRGGIKTDNERRREKEVEAYEEENFTRLPNTMTKKDKRLKRKDMTDSFGGEDWSMFSNSRNFNDSTSRKRKTTSVWDKVKRRK